MKCKALFFILFFPAFLSAQNLVPNWSFEEYEECPDNISQIERATGWMSFRITPDYFNACAVPGGVSVPDNFMTSGTSALHGDAYSGIGQIHVPSGNSELMGIELTNPLVVGQTYYLSFYVIRGVPATGSSNCWANRFGAQLTMQAYADWPWEVTMPISNAPHIYTENMISDTLNWTKIEGFFTSDSAYQFLAIGNHWDLDSLSITCSDEYFSYQVYYFVDCVCLAENPENCPECETVTSLNDHLVNDVVVHVFPNPFKDNFSVNFSNDDGIRKTIRFFGSDGRLISQETTSDNYALFGDVGHIAKGLYFLVVDYENGESQKFKLIKI